MPALENSNLVRHVIGEDEWPSFMPGGKESIRPSHIQRNPAAYIVTDNRGKRYLVFAGSVEHENAAMFKYDIKPLYE